MMTKPSTAIIAMIVILLLIGASFGIGWAVFSSLTPGMPPGYELPTEEQRLQERVYELEYLVSEQLYSLLEVRNSLTALRALYQQSMTAAIQAGSTDIDDALDAILRLTVLINRLDEVIGNEE